MDAKSKTPNNKVLQIKYSGNIIVTLELNRILPIKTADRNIVCMVILIIQLKTLNSFLILYLNEDKDNDF